ncbi:metalloregulator ArsR/SmtB family transcription factor [Aquibacillus koreensis]|uniref:Metalloregulator ArsR/SmtB family transcription factor n=1 Tax=Aquibacillus koreensis TaxID=279446 RepID=A0A9X3WKW7_9BACI|nr:metalloregulator ArsR/SmtB family transcription factor [Aquibacillus koreensis]MCT2536876.1 metalloregulator ArsR/SmtB family transcription factor [Aquibacillus koreensis]MDC3421992.1 metalloregulator ArsR/SmtB family transcription factor [Aquibacillus koreensis]
MSKKDTCEVYCYDEEKVNRIQAQLQKEDIAKITKLFKALADENRSKACYALCVDEELCVCDIANIIGSSVATASHHLRSLHKQGIVKYRKEGKLAFYSLKDKQVKQLILTGLTYRQEVNMNV